jgi:hypothetical protein
LLLRTWLILWKYCRGRGGLIDFQAQTLGAELFEDTLSCVEICVGQIVIDRKRIFLFWPKTNIRQENAAEYSAHNEYSAQGSKHCKNVDFNENRVFSGVLVASCSQLIVKIYGQQKHSVHKTLTMTKICFLFFSKKMASRKKWHGNGKLINKTLFRFRQHLPNIRFDRIGQG